MTEVGAKDLDFLSKEPVEGELLAGRLARGALSPEEALRHAIEIGAALHRAHVSGAVHGKLSPDAVLLTGAGARILQPANREQYAAPYRSPEQILGAAPDTRSDIFAYGALLYEMASGRRAFAGEGRDLDAVILEKPPAPLLAQSPVHAAMEGVIAGCVEKDPACRRQRIQNAVSELNTTGYERAQLWPQFLPGGKHFLFFSRTDFDDTTGVYAGTLGSPDYKLLFPSETNAVYSTLAGADSSGKGYLLFMRGRNLMAQAFHAGKTALEGEPITLTEDVGAARSLSLAPISVSNNALLVYQSVGRPTRVMTWMDRAGNAVGAASEGGEWGPPKISPDGTRAVVGKVGPDGVHADLWLLEPGGRFTRFTDTPVQEGSPVWSPDGSRIVYNSTLTGAVTSLPGPPTEPATRN